MICLHSSRNLGVFDRQVKLLMFIPVRKLVLDLQVLFNRLLIRPGNPKCPSASVKGGYRVMDSQRARTWCWTVTGSSGCSTSS
jgi:hypothetical protein